MKKSFLPRLAGVFLGAALLALSIGSCSLGAGDGGSVSLSVTAPSRAGSPGRELYYEVAVLHLPAGRQATEDEFSFLQQGRAVWSLRFKGTDDEVYLLAVGEGTVTEGVPSEITVNNVPFSDKAAVSVVFGEYEDFMDDRQFLYQGGVGTGVIDNDPTPVVIGEGTTRVAIQMQRL